MKNVFTGIVMLLLSGIGAMYAQSVAEINKQAGQKYIEEQMQQNRKMKKTSSGLVYFVMKKGKGKQHPTLNSTVKVNYKGYGIDGQIFDESKEPISFKLTQVILGWQEGVQLMKVGEKCKLIIPSNLAYGDNGINGVIAPGATLVFEVELLEITN